MSSLIIFVTAALRHPILQVLSVIGATFILEDAATVVTAMQVQAGSISLEIGLGSLYAGIILGDLGLYGMGRLAAICSLAGAIHSTPQARYRARLA